jgi:hypothetical protein
LVEIIEERIKNSQKKAVVNFNKIVCDGRLKASLLVETEAGHKHVIEVLEDDLATFRRDDNVNLLLRQRGRIAQKLVR